VVAALALTGGGLYAFGVFNPPATPTPTSRAPATAAPASATVAVAAAATASPTPPAPTATPEPTATVEPSATPTVTLTQPPTATPRGGGPGQVAFVSERVGGIPQIFVVDVNSPTKDSDLQPLTTSPDGACQPAWSPDGRKLLFISPCRAKDDSYPNAIIYVMNADGSDIQPLIQRVGGNFSPDWSPAGILFTYLTNNRPQIWVAEADGSNARVLSRGTSADSHPSWSPDGERIVFRNTTRAGRSQPDQVTRDLDAAAPDWSPNGDLVAFVSGASIYVVPWDARGFNAQNITGAARPNDDPDFSPDGRWIVFESWRDNANHNIYIMTTSGSTVTALTQDPAWDYQPAWRP